MRLDRFEPRVSLVDSVGRSIVDHARSDSDRELGGLLFGRVSPDGPTISIEQVHHAPIERSRGNATHFSIDPEYATKIINDPRYMTYLGNWHSHLGYGGPSAGDDAQVTSFFLANPEKRHYVALIADRNSRSADDYTIRIRVYRNEPNSMRRYEASDIPPQVIEVGEERPTIGSMLLKAPFSKPPRSSTKTAGGASGRMREGALEACLELQRLTEEAGIGARTELLSGPNSGEHLLRIHAKYEARSEAALTAASLEAVAVVSFPLDFPAGEIFVDVATPDQTRQFTVKRIASSRFHSDPRRLVAYLEFLIEDLVPLWLEAPLWRTLGGARWQLSK